jgi:hypothetical protein
MMAMTKTTPSRTASGNYNADLWRPMTTQMYSEGAYYLLRELQDGKWVDIRPLGLEEALRCEMSSRQGYYHVYPEGDK